jgi:REP element-mobilizing transposase RayT
VSRARKQYLPNTVYEVTRRTTQGRYLLLPTDDCRLLVLGVLARALLAFPTVQLHAFVYLSNHVHMLLSSTCAQTIPEFLWFVNRTISVEIGELFDWPGTFWEGRAEPIPVVDDDALIRRLRYLLSNGCKEGLVGSPIEWPGASAVAGLLGDMTLTGITYDRDAMRAARRKGPVDPADFARTIQLELAPIPPWRDLPAAELRARHRSLVDEIEVETARNHERNGTRPAGKAAILSYSPHYRPPPLERTPRPQCHSTVAALRRAFAAARREFDRAYDAAAERLRKLARRARRGTERPPRFDVTFPPGCFPPALPFVPPPNEGLTSGPAGGLGALLSEYRPPGTRAGPPD